MEFSNLDLLFGGIVIILMALSFIGTICIVLDDTGKSRIRTKREEEKKKDQDK
jgi:hypothetical protein